MLLIKFSRLRPPTTRIFFNLPSLPSFGRQARINKFLPVLRNPPRRMNEGLNKIPVVKLI
jgi:hypothetical protein